MNKHKPALEAIPLFAVYSKDGQTVAEMGEEANEWHVYGFLKIFIRILEHQLIHDIDPGEPDAET